MAEQKSLKERFAILDKITDGINEKNGRVVAGRLGKLPALMDKLTIKYIPTPSMNINDALGGGFPKGRSTIVAGLPDSGKTSIVLETIAFNMKKDPNFIAGWLESENSLEKTAVCDMFGIDPDRFLFIEHNRKDAGEGALDQVEAILSCNVCDIFCINSLKCLVPTEEFEKSNKKVQVGAQSRMNSKMSRKFAALVTESQIAFVLITHLTTQIGSMSHDPLIVSGGNSIIYGAAIIIDLRKKGITDEDPITREDGIKIGLTVKKNHTVPTKNPYVKVDYFAIFGFGIEIYLEAIENAIIQGVLFKAGAWIRDIDPETGDPKILEDGVKLNFCGKKAFRQYCIDNPAYFENLLTKISAVTISLSSEEIDEIKAEEAEILSSLPDDLLDDKPKSKKKK